MKKRFCALLFVWVMFTACMSNTYATTGYMPGPITHSLSVTYCSASSNATISSNTIMFAENGYTEYDFYLPFDAVSVTFTYVASEDVEMDIDTGVLNESAILPTNEGTENGEFTHTFSKVERKGERVFRFTVGGAISITDITFHKAQVQRTDNTIIEPSLSDNEKIIQSAVLLDTDASILMVNGGRRYIDINEPTETCQIIDGSIYLPAATLARALGYYYEDMPDRFFALLRHDTVEFCFSNNISYKENYNSYATTNSQDISNMVVYKNGETYLPVRYFAEALDKTVGYRDGIVAIDDKFSVDNILYNETVFAYVREKFFDFHTTQSAGNTYYVAQNSLNASDSNTGTENAPFKTIKKAGEVTMAGDTVIIKEGVYREILTVQNNGTPTAPIVFQAAEGENVVISAAEEVSGFVYAGNGVYTAPISWDLGQGRNQVYYAGESLVEARYPNGPILAAGDGQEDFGINWPVKGDLHLYTLEDREHVVSDTLLDQEQVDYWKGGIFVGSFGNAYWLCTELITASEKGKLTIEAQEETNFDNSISYGGWNYGSIVGHMNCLDIANEWIIQNNTLYLIPPMDADVNNLTVEVKKRQLVADLSNNNYVQLKGIHTIGGSMKMNESKMCVINDCEIKYNNHYVLSKDQHSGYIDDANVNDQNGAPPRGEVGIYVGGSDNVFVNNTIDQAAGAAIYGVGLYTYIDNNIISDCGYAGSYVAGLNFNTESWKPDNTARGGHGIYANTVYNAGRSVLHHTRAAHHGVLPYLPEEIAFNDFHDGIANTLDTGITYEYMINMGCEKLKTKYHNNYVYYTMRDTNPYSMGIYHDGSTQSVDTFNNLVFTTSEGTSFWNSYVYTQTISAAYSDCDTWNNSMIYQPVSGGPKNLTAKDFPDEKPFYAGANQDGSEYLVNYNHIINNVSPGESNNYYAKDAVASAGVNVINGAAEFTETDQWLKFDVDCGTTGCNRFTLGFLGDKYNTGDTAEIIIGNTIAEGTTYAVTLNTRATYEEQVNFVTVKTPVYKGNQSVWVRPIGIVSGKIVSMKPQYYRYGRGELNADLIYGGRFTNYVAGYAPEPPTIVLRYGANEPMVYRLWPDSVLAYENVTFDEAVNTYTATMATDPFYSGQVVQIHLGSPTATPIGEYQNLGVDFKIYNDVTTTLNQTILPGTYDVYLTFGRNSAGRGTCTFKSFKFTYQN